MKKVVQEQPMGCGIACVASATGKTYGQVLKIVDIRLASGRGYYCKELVDALAKFGMKYDYKKVTEKTKLLLLRKGTIVFIARSNNYPEGHYLLRTENRWMNPWINYPTISPAKAGFEKKLPGKAQWVLFQVEDES